MLKSTSYDNKTHQSVVTTEYVWFANNGHKVIVKNRKSIDTNTINSHLYRFNTTTFKCECGKNGQVKGSAFKAELNNHDSWLTEEERVSFLAKLVNA